MLFRVIAVISIQIMQCIRGGFRSIVLSGDERLVRMPG